MKICTDPSEIKPLLNGSDTSKGCDASKLENSESVSLNDSSTPNMVSPTLCDIKNLKSEQYSALFETACEIEYYTCHKKILPSGSKPGRNKSEKRKPHARKDAFGKSHSATSSPIRHGENFTPAVFAQKKRNTLDLETACSSTMNKPDPEGIALANEGINEILKSPNFEVLEQTEILTKNKLRQSSRSSSRSSKQGDDDVWEQADKDSTYYKSSGQALPTTQDAKQVIETTC